MSNPSISSIAQSFKAGDKLAGCYTLKEILPDQGFCVVWLAHDEELNRDIALHFVPDAVAADSRAMSELKQEAKRNRQLIHPRIVRVHDLVEDEKWAAISMDHVQGETLAALQQKKEKNAFDPSALAAGISELCQTLEDAHRIDLFHRDLTPANLLLTGNGLMVQKFGISRVILDSLAGGGRKIEGSRDIAYMSPQQLDAERPSRSDDIYSIGASLYDLLTGAPPFNEGDIISQIRKTVPQPVSERRAARGISGEPLPKGWDEAIAACLAKTPDERPKSAAEAGGRFSSGKIVPPPAQSDAPAPAAVAEAKAADAKSASGEPAAGAPEAPAAAEKEVKQQKRPWNIGPGKAPVIAEATVLSNTPVPKGDKGDKGDQKAEGAHEASNGKPGEPATGGSGLKKGGPTTPTGFPLRAFVEVEGDAKPKKNKSSAGMLAGAALIVLILIVSYIVSKSSEKNASENAVASTGTSGTVPAGSEATPAASPEEAGSPVPTPVNMEASPAPSMAEASATPVPEAPAANPPVAAVAESPGAAPIAASSLAAMSDADINKLLADKAKAVDQAKAALDTAEKESNDKASAQALAATAVQEIKATVKQKTDAAATAKKAADDAAAALQQQQDALQKADADAADAQKIADQKKAAADQMRKGMQDAQAAAQQQQAAQQQAASDAASVQKAVADRQQAADAATKAAADAEKARGQDEQALKLAQSDLAQLQAGIQETRQARSLENARKAAEQAAAIKKARADETAKLAAQAAAAAKAAADAQKALEVAQKAVADAENAQKAAEAQAAAAQSALAAPMASPAAAGPAPSVPAASPAAIRPASAAASPATQPSPSLTVLAPNPHLKVDQVLTNSLGMRFAPVGNVFFAVWLTRVKDFEAFAKATGYKGTAWREPGFKQGADHPVVNVSWNDANQFCLWLTGKEHSDGILAANETYRLPTDLEWSNAVGLPPETGRTPEARDMDVPDVYPWGTQWPPPAGAGNYTGEETDSDVAIKGYNDGFAWTSPVGSFNPNKFGLYDMGGNVWEWCLDWWNSEQKGKVLRGASWYNGALKLSLLSSCRIHANPDQGTDNYGFRVVIAEEMTKDKGAKKRE